MDGPPSCESSPTLAHTFIQQGWTPLMRASYSGHLDVVKALVAAGADVNARVTVGGEGLRLDQ